MIFTTVNDIESRESGELSGIEIGEKRVIRNGFDLCWKKL